MNPERGSAPVGKTEAQGKRLPEAWSQEDTGFRYSGLLHISFSLSRARNNLARLIATKDQIFSRDLSLLLDRQQVEIESLRDQLAAR